METSFVKDSLGKRELERKSVEGFEMNFYQFSRQRAATLKFFVVLERQENHRNFEYSSCVRYISSRIFEFKEGSGQFFWCKVVLSRVGRKKEGRQGSLNRRRKEGQWQPTKQSGRKARKPGAEASVQVTKRSRS